MFGIDTEYDPITPSGSELLESLDLDARAVRDALSDDLARRCPDCPVPVDGRWWRA